MKTKHIVILLILTLSVYLAMIFVTIPSVKEFANGMELPDLMPGGYSPEYLKELFGKLGDWGRNAYLWHQLPLDFIYPGLFMLTYFSIISKIYSQFTQNTSLVKWLAFSAVLWGLFDYLENAAILTMLVKFPFYVNEIAPFSSVFTIAKAVFSSVAFTLILAWLLALPFWGRVGKAQDKA